MCSSILFFSLSLFQMSKKKEEDANEDNDDNDDDDNKTSEIDLFCDEHLSSSISSPFLDDDDDDDYNFDEKKTTPFVSLTLLKDFDNNSTPMAYDLDDKFYKCIECRRDEEFETLLDTNLGGQKTLKNPFSLIHLTLVKVFNSIWPVTLDKIDEMKFDKSFSKLSATISTPRVKPLLLRYLQSSGEVISTAEFLFNVINNFSVEHDRLLTSKYVKFTPICCCILQRRCIYSNCCLYTMGINNNEHTTNRFTHCCRGYYQKDDCMFFNTMLSSNFTLAVVT